MTEIGEVVNLFTILVQSEECEVEEGEYVKKGWSARVNNCGALGKCSGGRLYRKMRKDKDKDQGYLGGATPYVRKKKTTKLRQVAPDRFPIQAHHLIPKNFLPDEPVSAFLGTKYQGPKDFELHEDAPYSCDHANNGYCMPYATPLSEWKKASTDEEKLAITALVMNETGRQLHQGSHRVGPYEGPQEPGEEDNIHSKVPGYLAQIRKLLEVVAIEAAVHPIACDKCKPDSENKIPPREAIVRHMDQVSGITKLLVDGRRIFVSKPAFRHWSKNASAIEIPEWLQAAMLES